MVWSSRKAGIRKCSQHGHHCVVLWVVCRGRVSGGRVSASLVRVVLHEPCVMCVCSCERRAWCWLRARSWSHSTPQERFLRGSGAKPQEASAVSGGVRGGAPAGCGAEPREENFAVSDCYRTRFHCFKSACCDTKTHTCRPTIGEHSQYICTAQTEPLVSGRNTSKPP